MSAPILHPPSTPHSPAEAIDAFLSELSRVAEETVPLGSSSGRVLSRALRADRPSPPMNVSAMDGYAVRLSSLGEEPVVVAEESRIGHSPPAMPDVGCVRIATGAPIPPGADAVVKRESVREHPADAPGEVRAILVPPEIASMIRPGEHIRRAGENAAAGAVIAKEGSIITPALAGALASFGVDRPTVYRALRITILSTGDEVVHAGDSSFDAPPPWRIRDGNGPALTALLRTAGWIGSIDCLHVRDDEGSLDHAVRSALEASDALILTGGVSMGHRDLVPGVLARRGVRTLFHGLPQRPGRPMLGGVTADGRPVLALPGNPVSVLVTATRIGGPVLARRAGVLPDAHRHVVTIANPDQSRIGLWWHRLVRGAGPGLAMLVDARGSGDLVAAAGSDGFVEYSPDSGGPGPWPFYAWSLS